MEKETSYFDITYIKKFMDNDDSAFEVIYEYYKNHIYYMGMQFFHQDCEKSKDLVQNTFIEIYINIKKLKAPEAFYVWMNQIAYRQGCHMLRYSSKDSSYYTNDVEEEYFEDIAVDHKQKDITSEMQKKQAIEIIMEALNELDDDKRLVGYLRYFEELSIKEIHTITDIPMNTIGSHLHRIKAKCKKKLEARGFRDSTCFGLLLIPNMTDYFKALIAQEPPMPSISINDIITSEHVKDQKSKKKNKLWLKLSQAFYCVAILLPSFAVVSPILQQTTKKSEPLSKFSEVSFFDEITNQPISIDVKTTNNNYDAILLNDSTKLKVSSNGTYRLSLMKQRQIIDEKTFKISNIDTDIPEVANEIISEDHITFELKDDMSGVDYKNITYTVNGQKDSSIQIDKEAQKIVISNNGKVNHQLSIPDIAGNNLTIKINSFEISAK